MKKIFLAMLAMVAVASLAHAREYPLNPDRFPSMGLTIIGEAYKADQEFPSLGIKQPREDGYGYFIVDTRLPFSNSWTLDLALGSAGHSEKADQTPDLPSMKFNGSGGYFRLGVRYYFNKGAKDTGL